MRLEKKKKKDQDELPGHLDEAVCIFFFFTLHSYINITPQHIADVMNSRANICICDSFLRECYL